MSAQPWMKFYPADWRADPGLRMCGYAARGLWADMLSLMHFGEPYGHLTVAGKQPTAKQLSGILGGSPAEVERLTAELEQAGVFSRSANGLIYSRRMVRDKERAQTDSKNGKRGGNPKLNGNGTAPITSPPNPGVNPPDKAHMLDARDQKLDKIPKANALGDSLFSDGAAVIPLHLVRPEGGDWSLALYRQGLAYLSTVTGKSPDQLRSLVGKWLKTAGTDHRRVFDLLAETQLRAIASPVDWVTKSLGQSVSGAPAAQWNGSRRPERELSAAEKIAYREKWGMVNAGWTVLEARIRKEGLADRWHRGQ